MTQNVADYAARMEDLLTALAKAEDRSQLEIFHDLIKAGFDILRVRSPEADEAGTIDLDHGVTLYDHARDLIASAANAAVKPKRAYRGAAYDIARDYMQQLRLGQTEVGSYVLTVLSPVPPILHSRQDELFPELATTEEPFSRTVTQTLHRALLATQAAVTEATATGQLAPFESAVGEGVSANLCEAIARMATHSQGVDLSLSWSRVRPVPGPVGRYVFTSDDARVLSEAASAFREKEPQVDATIDGFVVSLHREPQDFDGRAKIRGFIDRQVRTVTAQFLHSDYIRVIEAHNSKQRVNVDGDLIRRGQLWFLQNPRNLVVYDEEPADGSVL